MTPRHCAAGTPPRTSRPAIALVDAVAVAAEAAGHHPDIDIRWRDVLFVLSTHSEGGVTGKDVDLAKQIDRLARAPGSARWHRLTGAAVEPVARDTRTGPARLGIPAPSYGIMVANPRSTPHHPNSPMDRSGPAARQSKSHRDRSVDAERSVSRPYAQQRPTAGSYPNPWSADPCLPMTMRRRGVTRASGSRLHVPVRSHHADHQRHHPERDHHAGRHRRLSSGQTPSRPGPAAATRRLHP